ncbi:MAG: hypothetical protein RIF32_20875 [Leptospirales bacterium]
MIVRMHKTPVPGLHAAAAIAMIVGCVVVLFGPFEHKLFLLMLIPSALFFGYVMRGEYRRGVRAIDAARDRYLPIAEKRESAVRILADWRSADPEEVRAAVDALSDDDIGVAGPAEIACMAVRNLDVSE